MKPIKNNSDKPLCLLHICCGPCGTSSILKLKEKYDIVLYFDNSNIHPYAEYKKRRKYVYKLADIHDLNVIEAEYDINLWMSIVWKYKHFPEGSKRCEECIKMRLLNTAKTAEKNNIPFFTTTLTVSPYKNSNTIFSIGKEMSDNKITFLEYNFKKQNGYQVSINLSKKYNFYRQNYCGCILSAQDLEVRKSTD